MIKPGVALMVARHFVKLRDKGERKTWVNRSDRSWRNPQVRRMSPTRAYRRSGIRRLTWEVTFWPKAPEGVTAFPGYDEILVDDTTGKPCQAG